MASPMAQSPELGACFRFQLRCLNYAAGSINLLLLRNGSYSSKVIHRLRRSV
jgi:hypothetical protein